jgi:hypothetical protein
MNQSNKDGLTYKSLELAGKVMCSKKKVDVTAAKKPATVIPKTLKRLNAGHRCKTQSTLVREKDEAVITA